MKKLFTLIIASCFAATLFAQESNQGSIVSIYYELQIGYLPQGIVPMYDLPAFLEDSKMVETTMSAELRLFNNLIFAGGYVRTYLEFEGLSGFPFQSYYGFSLGIRPTKNIEIGWKHVCLHAVVCSGNSSVTLDMNYPVDSYNEIYVSIHGEIPLF